MISELAELKAEGKALIALITGLWGLDAYRKTFTALKRATGLSAPWLAEALRKLAAKGYIKRSGRFYQVDPRFVKEIGCLLKPFYGGYLIENARWVSDELSSRYLQVEAIILFGSVAAGRADYDSDVDLLILLKPYDNDLSFQVYKFVNNLSFDLEVPIEPIPMAADDFRLIVKKELQFLFGVLEGYIILYDKRDWTEVMQRKSMEIEQRYEYVEEIPMWIPRRR